ncbi:MAG TPA: hypothetical protein PLM24_00655 [Methanothrix sp.]|nr:hypothetical protein [Methanothrix sp.]HPJ84145.1 hypothetical protein [Methanothrix sp.]HPR65627.1 hypothetical protein [Methanothrix sp.]
MIREDFDRIYAKRISHNDFNGKVRMFFSDFPQVKEITLLTASDVDLPSEKAAMEIQKVIDEKKKLLSENPTEIFDINYKSSFASVPYEDTSIDRLEKYLRNIKETFKEQDNYELYELRSHKLNITIINEGDAYIEDAQFQIDIDKKDGLRISKEIFMKPRNPFRKPRDPLDYSVEVPNLDLGSYPEVEDKGTYISINNRNIWRGFRKWDIKHHIPEKAFLEPIRILLLKKLAGNVIELKCRLYGKNLKEPLEEILKIKVVLNN